jgi:hypothetical protein
MTDTFEPHLIDLVDQLKIDKFDDEQIEKRRFTKSSSSGRASIAQNQHSTAASNARPVNMRAGSHANE